LEKEKLGKREKVRLHSVKTPPAKEILLDSKEKDDLPTGKGKEGAVKRAESYTTYTKIKEGRGEREKSPLFRKGRNTIGKKRGNPSFQRKFSEKERLFLKRNYLRQGGVLGLFYNYQGKREVDGAKGGSHLVV